MMRKLILFIVWGVVVAFGVSWLSQQTGKASIEWLGWQIDVSSSLLVSLQSKLPVEHVIPLVVVVLRIAVHFEFNTLNHTLSWEVAVVHVICNRLSRVH